MAAPGIAPALTALESAIDIAVENSKITNTIDKEISKSLGLLLDLILIPFLPILAFGLVQLYLAVIGFGKDWKTIWDTIKKEGLFGLIKLSLAFIWDTILAWEKALLEWLFSPKPLTDKIVDLVLALATLAGGFFAFIGEKVIGAILNFIFGEGTYEKGKQVVIQMLADLIGDPLGMFARVLGWAFGVSAALFEDAIKIGLAIINKGSQMIFDFFSFIWEVATGVKKLDIIDIIFSLIPKNPADAIWGIIKWLMSSAGNLMSKWTLGVGEGYSAVPHLATGGTIAESGIAVVHKGETITPAGQGSGHTFIFNGYQDDVFIQKIRDVMRQEGSRYQL